MKKSSKNLIEQAKSQAHRSHLRLTSKYPHVATKLRKIGVDIKDIRRHSAKAIASAALASGLVMGSPSLSESMPSHVKQERQLSPEEAENILKEELKNILPKEPGPLPPEKESEISNVFFETLGIHAVAELDGNHLNTSYGRMGGEQHMPRFPGDTLSQHDELQVKGITAHRGAFGYFANSKEQMTEEAIQQEKYYVAVQTLYLPNWNRDHPTLKKWYQFRKVLVVNPTNGRSIVAVVGDAGPAAWTKKHFGGSPEVMAYLEPWKDKNNGAVLLFFIDDIEHPVALGPVTGQTAELIAKQ